MDYALPIVVGVIGLCFLIAYIMNTLDPKEHQVLKVIMFFFIISLMLVIPKVAVDATTICETVVSNSTQLNSSVIAYEYEEFCFERPEKTGVSFLQVTERLHWIVWGYVVVFIMYHACYWLYESVKRRRG